MPQIDAIAFSNVARTSPTLPPSAIRTLAMLQWMPVAGQYHADILEDRGDRRVRLVHGDLDCSNAQEGRQDSIRDRAGGARQELVVGVPESGSRGCDYLGIRH